MVIISINGMISTIKSLEKNATLFDGLINNDIHAVIYEYGDCFGVSMDCNEIRAFGELLDYSFKNCFCYLHVKVEILSAVKRKQGVWKYLGIKYLKGLISETTTADENGLVSTLGKFQISDFGLVAELLEKYPLSSIAFISDSEEQNAINEILCRYCQDELPQIINAGCEKLKAVICLINGNNGNSLCCFSKHSLTC